MSLDPIEVDDELPNISSEELRHVDNELKTLGFKALQARKATDFMMIPSPMASMLLASQGLLAACLEYLILHTPECDLPERFLPSQNSSDAFIKAVHVGTDNLKTRWLVEKATKEAGWPIHIVRECLQDSRIDGQWELLLAAMAKRLLGEDAADIFDQALPKAEVHLLELDDIEALGAEYKSKDHVVMPLFGAPIQWHILVSPNEYPRAGFAPMYLTSSTVPAYIRLHMLSCLLRAMTTETFDETGGGFCLAGMAVLDEEWSKIEAMGPPSISQVFQHFHREVSEDDSKEDVIVKGKKRVQGKAHVASRDPRSDVQVKETYAKTRQIQKAKFAEMMATRNRLPAFQSKDEFLGMLESSRVVVVVGETGCGKTTQRKRSRLLLNVLFNRCSQYPNLFSTRSLRATVDLMQTLS